jgi:biopolymer transport protein ExbD
VSGGGGAPAEEAHGGQKTVFGEEAVGPVELNLTALMDILSNLLFFLLASFGATIVMAINGTVPVQSADKSDVADTSQTVTVAVTLSKAGYEITPMGMAQKEEELAPLRKKLAYVDGHPDYAGLANALLDVKSHFPKSDTIILTPEAGVSYSLMIKTMDAARQTEVRADGKLQVVKLFPTVVVSTVVK